MSLAAYQSVAVNECCFLLSLAHQFLDKQRNLLQRFSFGGHVHNVRDHGYTLIIAFLLNTTCYLESPDLPSLQKVWPARLLHSTVKCPTSVALRWRDTKINDIHDFTLHC